MASLVSGKLILIVAYVALLSGWTTNAVHVPSNRTNKLGTDDPWASRGPSGLGLPSGQDGGFFSRITGNASDDQTFDSLKNKLISGVSDLRDTLVSFVNFVIDSGKNVADKQSKEALGVLDGVNQQVQSVLQVGDHQGQSILQAADSIQNKSVGVATDFAQSGSALLDIWTSAVRDSLNSSRQLVGGSGLFETKKKRKSGNSSGEKSQ